MIQRTFVGLIALLACSSQVLCQSAYGIKLPVRGAQEAVSDNGSSLAIDEPTGLDSFKAKTLDEAASGAAKQAAKPEQTKGQSKFRKIEGAVLFEDANGATGMMVSGVGRYSSEYPNPDAVRQARRSAYVAAYADAMRLLAEKVYGSSIEQKVEIAKKLKISTTEIATASEASTDSVEKINEAISGLIRGSQVWKCTDEGADVRVWLFMTKESVEASKVVDGSCKVASRGGYQSAVDSIIDECTNGFLPPIGGKCVIDPVTGLVTFVGFGSSIIQSIAMGETMALKAAQARAKAGLVGIMTGQQVDYTAQLGSTEQQAISDYKNYANALPPAGQEGAVAAKARNSFGSVQELSEALSLVTRGKLPPGTQDLSFVDDETGWVTSVYIYSVGSEALVEALRSDTPVAPGERVESTPVKAPVPTYDPTKRGPSGEGKDPRKSKQVL